ncbi:MAG: UDP-N-acetylmuramate dehydrogenase [Cyanobacteriota bacterium]|nr:UDP-N-acetylmuramate dehydrogenase [Cyanobacteriota bacterium]MDY6358844.1 UDP-N-acetylmuramate dehydrogenase [Cyanobacteriota bacterium]MDY6364219.1 UDP-N-acetylmuramate dehydrogenase [Cyanobacteriota bacterium]
MTENIEKDFEIKNYTTFKIGGKIDEVFFPSTVDEFVHLLQKYPNIPVLGNLSDTLVSTFGYGGAVILTSKMNNITIDGTNVSAECGVKGPKLAQEVCKSGLSGLEFMIGFPGSIGGEVYMNASANGQCISDNLISVQCYSREMGLITLKKEQMGFEYRSSRCEKDNLIVLKADFELTKKNVDDIKSQMEQNLEFRKKHQPSLALPNCGSIFKNPPCNPAGKLLESVGAKEILEGGARVWRNHSNFIVNVGGATSTDVLRLMSEMQLRVREMYNINLEPEIKYLGNKSREEMKLWQKLTKK